MNIVNFVATLIPNKPGFGGIPLKTSSLKNARFSEIKNYTTRLIENRMTSAMERILPRRMRSYGACIRNHSRVERISLSMRTIKLIVELSTI